MTSGEGTEIDDIGVRLSENELCPADLLQGQEAAFERDIARLHSRSPEFVEVSCPACDERSRDTVFTKFGFSYIDCSNCGTIYMSPRPSETLMSDYYSNSENYKYWAEHIFPASEDSRREKIHKPWLKRVISYCDRYSVNKGILVEVGAGFGTFSQVATQSRSFDRVVAIEPTPEMASACRQRGVEVLEMRVEDVAIDDVSADVLVSFEVIEHLFEPKIFLERCQRFIRPGGLLVLSCPNGQGFDISLLGAGSLAVDAEHVNLFNPHSLGMLVETNGFEVLEVSTPGRLDAELVRDVVLKGEFDISGQPFLQRILIDEWERMGWPFQQFLADHGLSSHMWLAARRTV